MGMFSYKQLNPNYGTSISKQLFGKIVQREHLEMVKKKASEYVT
jgi:hypothetical protein